MTGRSKETVSREPTRSSQRHRGAVVAHVQLTRRRSRRRRAGATTDAAATVRTRGWQRRPRAARPRAAAGGDGPCARTRLPACGPAPRDAPSASGAKTARLVDWPDVARRRAPLSAALVFPTQPIALDFRALQMLAASLDFYGLIVDDLLRVWRGRIRPTRRHDAVMSDSREPYKRKIWISRPLTR